MDQTPSQGLPERLVEHHRAASTRATKNRHCRKRAQRESATRRSHGRVLEDYRLIVPVRGIAPKAAQCAEPTLFIPIDAHLPESHSARGERPCEEGAVVFDTVGRLIPPAKKRYPLLSDGGHWRVSGDH